MAKSEKKQARENKIVTKMIMDMVDFLWFHFFEMAYMVDNNGEDDDVNKLKLGCGTSADNALIKHTDCESCIDHKFDILR